MSSKKNLQNKNNWKLAVVYVFSIPSWKFCYTTYELVMSITEYIQCKYCRKGRLEIKPGTKGLPDSTGRKSERSIRDCPHKNRHLLKHIKY